MKSFLTLLIKLKMNSLHCIGSYDKLYVYLKVYITFMMAIFSLSRQHVPDAYRKTGKAWYQLSLTKISIKMGPYLKFGELFCFNEHTKFAWKLHKQLADRSKHETW